MLVQFRVSNFEQLFTFSSLTLLLLTRVRLVSDPQPYIVKSVSDGQEVTDTDGRFALLFNLSVFKYCKPDTERDDVSLQLPK